MKPKHNKARFFSNKGLFTCLGSFTELETRISDLPEYERGNAFEVFAEAYFKTQARFQAREVWPFSELPQNIRRELGLPDTDMGIDGVFQTHDGNYHAYQVKYRTHRPSLSWPELATFMALSDKAYQRVVITNSNDLASATDNRVNFYSIRGNDLDEMTQSEFQAIETWLQSGIVLLEKKSPRPHQIEAINDIIKELEVSDRTTAIMACGTGKTLVALWVAEKKEAQTILVLLPSLALVRQILHDWAKESSWKPFNFLCVCSDQTVAQGIDEIKYRLQDLDFPVTTQKEHVEKFLKNKNSSRKIIFSTYQSCHIVAEAIPQAFSFDLGIFDEAHKTASRDGAHFAFALQDKNVSIKQRLFLTATPRHYNVNKKDKEGDQQLVFSMDDQTTYGKIAHQLSFRPAVKKEIICDYKVVISIVTSGMINREILKHGDVVFKGDIIKAQRIANILAVQNAIDKYGVKRIFSFHSSVASAQSFTSPSNEGIGAHLEDFTTLHVNGAMSTNKREALLKEFKEAKKAIISNARCLTEGVDLPVVDMVTFVSPKKSRVDIVQAVGRAMRKAEGKDVGYILIPLFVQIAENESIEEAIEKTKFDTVWDVLQAMQEQDESLVEIIAQIREDIGKALGFNDNRLREKIEFLGPQIYLETLRNAITTKIVDKLGLTWDERLGELIQFRQVNGHCNVPRSYSKNRSLGIWVDCQRQWNKKGKILKERVDKLNKLGFIWKIKEVAVVKTWSEWFEVLCKFKKENGHCDVPYDCPENPALRIWVHTQRQKYSEETLPADRIEKLNEIGFVWEPGNTNWEKMFFALQAFKIEKHHCNVPQKYTENPPLGIWISRQRTLYASGKLLQERFERLNKIGFDWGSADNRYWEEMFAALQAFAVKKGHCNVPASDSENLALGTWVNAHRQKFKKKKLSADRIKRLETIGFDWDPINTYCEEMVSALLAFQVENGHCDVKRSYPENPPLAGWVNKQRYKYRQVTLSTDFIERLEKIGFDWDPDNTYWEKMFSALQEFQVKNGHCNVPQKYTKNPALGTWISTQRYAYKKQKISQERIDKLNNVGFVWRIK